MYKKVHLSVLSFIFFISIVSAVWSQSAKLDHPAPDFTLEDSNGDKHTLSDYLGKYIVLEWVNYDCPFVRKHYDSANMQNLQKKYTEEGVVWLSVCSSAPGKQGYFKPEKINALIKEKDARPSAYLIDLTGRVGKMYGAKTTPHMYIIDPLGLLVYAGGIDDTPTTKIADIKTADNYLVKSFDALFADKKIKDKSTTPYGCSVKY